MRFGIIHVPSTRTRTCTVYLRVNPDCDRYRTQFSIDSRWTRWWTRWNCSNGGPSRVTLQDIVRSDPGYTPNIEHLVFPERKSSNPNLASVVDGSPPTKSKSNATGRSRIAEVFARHYARGSSQDSSVTSRKNHVNVSIRNFAS